MAASPIYYFTANIKGKNTILKDDALKEMIIKSLSLTVGDGDITVFGYCILPNHFHLLWSMTDASQKEKVEESILGWTSQKIRAYFVEKRSPWADEFKSEDPFEPYSIWDAQVESVEIKTKDALSDRLKAIHESPCTSIWMLGDDPLDYPWSSAPVYDNGAFSENFVTSIEEVDLT